MASATRSTRRCCETSRPLTRTRASCVGPTPIHVCLTPMHVCPTPIADTKRCVARCGWDLLALGVLDVLGVGRDQLQLLRNLHNQRLRFTFAVMRSGSEEGSCLRLIDFCITQL